MKKRSFRHIFGLSIGLTLCLVMLSGCEDGIQHLFSAKKIPLKGQRISLYGLQAGTREKTVFSEEKMRVLLNPVLQWTQPGLNAQHHMGACALDGESSWPLKLLWKKTISGKAILPVAPIATKDRIFIANNLGAVFALDGQGKRIWSVQVDRNPSFFGMGGGLTSDGQRLYVTTPNSLVLALDCSTGKRLWQHTLSHPARNGPALSANRLAILTLANQVVLLDTLTGKEVWEVQGFKDDTLVLGGSVPAMTSDCVVVGSSSGEVMALSLNQGERLWEQQLGALVLEGEKNFKHIHAYPVIVGNHVYIASASGQLVCFDLYSGEVAWSQDVSAGQTPVIIGDGLVTVTANSTCLAVDRHTGKELWEAALPKQKRIFGPIMAGGLLYVLSENGQLYGLDPVKKGKKVVQISLNNAYTMAPIVIRGGLLFFSENGVLSFYKRRPNTKTVGAITRSHPGK